MTTSNEESQGKLPGKRQRNKTKEEGWEEGKRNKREKQVSE